MADKVGENGFHTVEVTSHSDDLQGDDVTIHYIQGDKKIKGDTRLGVSAGGQMQFTTDFEGKSITPGIWEYEFTHEDGVVTRQVGIEGESSNTRHVQVTDADTI